MRRQSGVFVDPPAPAPFAFGQAWRFLLGRGDPGAQDRVAIMVVAQGVAGHTGVNRTHVARWSQDRVKRPYGTVVLELVHHFFTSRTGGPCIGAPSRPTG